MLISPVVDGRFGATAVLGIPARDRTDEVIAERLGLDLPEAAESERERGARAERRRPRRRRPALGRRAPGGALPRRRLLDLAPALVGHADPDRLLRELRRGAGAARAAAGAAAARPHARPAPATRWPSSTEFVKTTCPRCGGPARRETDTLDCHFDALWLWIPACVPAGGARASRSRRSSRWPTCATGCPPSALVAGSDSGNFVFDQRIVTKALRDIGPLAFLADGEPFAGCLFHEMVISDGRKMSKHLGNVVDPDELVERYGADTVRLAVLYAARPQKLAELERLGGAALPPLPDAGVGVLATRARRRRGSSRAERGRRRAPRRRRRRADQRHHRAPAAQTREVVRDGVEKITEDMESLEMHSAVRNVMRLFDRIKDFEKRVLAREGAAERGRPRGADRRADACSRSCSARSRRTSPRSCGSRFGHDEHGAQTPWPGVSFRVPA